MPSTRARILGRLSFSCGLPWRVPVVPMIVADAERRFPVRIAIRLPPGGIGRLYKPMTDWLDENCGIGSWSMAPAGVRGVVDDTVAVYSARRRARWPSLPVGALLAIRPSFTICASAPAGATRWCDSCGERDS